MYRSGPRQWGRSPPRNFGPAGRSPPRSFGPPGRSPPRNFGPQGRSPPRSFGGPGRSPPRSFGPPGRSSPRSFGPPSRSPPRSFPPPGRSRSPLGGAPDRYSYQGPGFMDLPRMPQDGPSPYYRNAKMGESGFPPRPRPDFYDAYDSRQPYRDDQPNGYFQPPRRQPERVDRSPLRYERRPGEFDRRSGRPRYSMDAPDEAYTPKRDYMPPANRADGLQGAPRGYGNEEPYPPMPTRDYGPDEMGARRRSPDPRFNYRTPQRPMGPPRGGFYRGPSPRRWN